MILALATGGNHGTGSEDFLNHGWGMNDCAHWRNGSSIWEGHTQAGSPYAGARGAYSPRAVGGYQTSYLFCVDNPAFRQAMAEYDARAEEQGLAKLTTAVHDACRK